MAYIGLRFTDAPFALLLESRAILHELTVQNVIDFISPDAMFDEDLWADEVIYHMLNTSVRDHVFRIGACTIDMDGWSMITLFRLKILHNTASSRKFTTARPKHLSYYCGLCIFRMETGVTAFNVIFKELIMHVRNETSDKEPKPPLKQSIRNSRQRDVYLTEYVPTDVTIVDRKLDVEASLSDADAVERMKGILALLDVLKRFPNEESLHVSSYMI
jgi:hypothetical protein